MIIGVTGTFGTGKTTVANMFKMYGFEVINVDKLYHNIYNKDKALKNKIKKEFGTLDRNQIKKIVFNDYKKLKKLNNITHPIIIKAIKKEISSLIKKSNKKIIIKNLVKNNKIINKNNTENKIKIIIDIPLLFESKLENMFDKIIVVKCIKKEQFKRILKKGRYSRKEIAQIIKSQMIFREKIKKADFVVDNSKGINETQNQVNEIVNLILYKNLKNPLTLL